MRREPKAGQNRATRTDGRAPTIKNRVLPSNFLIAAHIKMKKKKFLGVFDAGD